MSGKRPQDATIISPVRRLWWLWLRLTWPFADRSRTLIKRDAIRLGFIHFAHWSLVTRMPPCAPIGSAVRLPYPYLLFQSNFDDDLNAYIDAFALVVPRRIQGMWGGAYQFPGTRPVDGFVRFIDDRNITSAYYYSAYPEASASMIRAALKLDARLSCFISMTERLGDWPFKALFTIFVAWNQRLL
jgi:hypothetical protein